MATVRREIEIDAPPSATQASWNDFLTAVRSSRYSLACDELACIDASRSGTVQFTPGHGGRTRMVVELDPDGGPSPDVTSQQLIHDLLVFKDYLEHGRGDGMVKREDRSRLHDDERHNEPARRNLPEENTNSPTGSSLFSRWPT